LTRPRDGTADAFGAGINLDWSTIMIRTLGLASILLGSSLITACATDTTGTTPGTDELAGENGQDGEKADGNALQDTFGIYTAQKVGAYECNGAGSCTHVDLVRAGRSTTTCADGSSKAACSVRGLDFTKLGLSSAKLTDAVNKLQASAATPEIGPQLLVRGKYIHSSNPLYPGVDWVELQVTELWVAQIKDAPTDGTLVMVRDNGRRCIDAPCGSIEEARLNSTRKADIDGLDWPQEYQKAVSSPGWLPNQVDTAITKADGVIVAGDRTHGTLMHLPTTLRSINQVFLNVK
jgi:hypothetical protein